MNGAGVDRPNAFYGAMDTVRRRGTIPLAASAAEWPPPPDAFDKRIQPRMGHADVERWVDAIVPLLIGSGDPPGVEGFATHRPPPGQGPHGYEIFQRKQDAAIKVLLQP